MKLIATVPSVDLRRLRTTFAALVLVAAIALAAFAAGLAIGARHDAAPRASVAAGGVARERQTARMLAINQLPDAPASVAPRVTAPAPSLDGLRFLEKNALPASGAPAAGANPNANHRQ